MLGSAVLRSYFALFPLLNFIYLILYLFVCLRCMDVLPICLSVYHVHGGQKRALDLLDGVTIISCHVGARNRT